MRIEAGNSYDSPSRRSGRIAALAIALALGAGQALFAERTALKPGWNLFSPEQDVQMGREVAADAERKLPMLRDRRVDDYLNELGRRLVARAPGAKYPYQFHAVNDRSINAFALPGGFLYVNRGVIEHAQNEAQLAGVIGHEIGHVALRHGTNQVTKSYAAQVPLAVLGGVLGSNSIMGVLAQVGAGFAVDSVLLKYSRDAERQSDLVGTQILYDAGYDPRAMAQFFEIIGAESGRGSRAPEWLSSHPSPENRMGRVMDEVQRLGGGAGGRYDESSQFAEIKRYVQSLPAPPAAQRSGQRSGAGQPRGTYGGRPPAPSSQMRPFQNSTVRLEHPENWTAYGQGNAFTLAPENGIVADRSGNNMVVYGVIASVFEPHEDRDGRLSLEEATDQLVDELRRSNPGMRVVRSHERERVSGLAALSTELRSQSPVSGAETDWLVTVLRPEGLFYFVFVAPQSDYSTYRRSFEAILDSVRFSGAS